MTDQREILNQYEFEMEIPNEPYIDNFSQGITHTAYYAGDRYLKFAVNDSTGIIGECLHRAPTVELLETRISHLEPGHTALIIDGAKNPWEASYLTRVYNHEPVPYYQEDVGQLDDDGNSITWEYNWGHVLNQIYYNQELKYINGEFVKPRFRVHQHTNEKVHQTVLDHIELCDNELSRIVYNESQRQAIEKCKAGWINIRDNFQHVHHWKLKYPDMPLIKP